MDVYVRCERSTEGRIKFPLPDSIVVFICAYCKTRLTKLHLITTPEATRQGWPSGLDFSTEILGKVSHQFIESGEVPDCIRLCELPAAISSAGRLVHSGLCVLVRRIIRDAHSEHPDSHLNQLLGHREVCLKACAEVSVWTRYCEVDLPAAVKRTGSKSRDGLSVADDDIAPELWKLENHLRQPPIVRNCRKRQREVKIQKQELDKDLLQSSTVELDYRSVVLEHTYAEGIDFTVTDLVLYPGVNYLLASCGNKSDVERRLPLTLQWCRRIQGKPFVQELVRCSGLHTLDISPAEETMPSSVTSLASDLSSLNIRDQEKDKVRIDSEQVAAILARMHLISVTDHHCKDVRLPWHQFPAEVHPRDGELPEKRVQRKCEQLENMACAVCRIAHPGDVIVDFCSGGGHLGILLAYLLPECKVILIENKEESISRAISRIDRLQQDNVLLYQCNLDCFHGRFDIGVTLHACGTATDLVLQRCLDNQASFVVCPCCYGGIKSTHTLAYPRSRAFMKTSITYQDYLLVGHAADQTEVKIQLAQQGKTCMTYIDSDRLILAREHGYNVLLSSLQPLSCSPKNNLLLGSRDRTWITDS